MKNRLSILAIAPLFLLTGCLPVSQQSYYVSPFNGNQYDYHPMPLHTDSTRSAAYAHLGFTTGGANEEKTDHVNSAQAAITFAHNRGLFQFYYGTDLTLGSYALGNWDTARSAFIIGIPPAHADMLNQMKGGRFFGGAGLHGGVNFVLPFYNGEWRVLGIETNLHREFGDYLSLRKHLPDSLAALNIRSPFFGTCGFTTEIIGRVRTGEFGFRLAMGGNIMNRYAHTGAYDSLSGRRLSYIYFNASFHYTFGRYTCYIQGDWATEAASLHIGISYRLGRPRLPPRQPHIDPPYPPFLPRLGH